MKKLLQGLIILGSILFFQIAYSAIPNNSHPTTFLGPTLNLGFSTSLTDTTAASLLGEGGPRNWRIGGTLAFKLMENQRFKVSAEYLWQRITYPFFSGNTTQWVRQGALGAVYQYNFCGIAFNPSFDISAYVSHAPNKGLDSVEGTFVRDGIETFLNRRRIAGSTAGGIAPGVTIQPWCGSNFGLALNYDNVQYDKKYPPSREAKGFGGTARFNQFLTDDIRLDLLAAVRKPFNNYQASLNWMNVPFYGRWTLDLDAAYTAGKETLPSTWNVGLSASYFLDQRCENRRDFKGEILVPIADDFVDWAADPAVYMPQVLAIPDEEFIAPSCGPVPVVIGTIPDQTGSGVVPTAGAFSPGTGLTYSLTLTPAPTSGNTATIDPATGVVTFTSSGALDETVLATVTASNGCGTAQTSFNIVFLED